MDTIENTPVFFILGRERSGTTMLRVNLNNHSKTNIPPESPFIIHLYKKYHSNQKIDTEEFIKDLKKETFFRMWKIDYKALTKILEGITHANFPNYCKAILSQEQQNSILLGDKNPINSLFGNKLIKVFPKAKFIWLIRDYRAQVNSMLKVNFEKKIISSLAARWVGFNKEIEHLKNNYPSQVLLIKYENLVENPEKQYSNICSFLEIGYEADILMTNRHKKEFNIKHHTSLEEKINTKHIKEWETDLSADQIKDCEAVAGNYGEMFGYKKKYTVNYPITIKIYLGVLYGKLYISFVKAMYNTPLKLRGFINKKIIFKNSPFWKEVKEYYKN